jgi:5-oxopent-3-ene-1,2,5-tricarboxylate decarboxylase / 2-hydroxyhepta-2,4-diene-1,7-dioate isomerase
VEVDSGEASSGRLRSPIVAGDEPLGETGAQPRVDEKTLDAAFGAGRTEKEKP